MELENFTNLFSNLQDYVSQILNADEILQQMGASFIAENSLDIEYQLKNALNKQGLACAVMTPRATYQGHNAIEQIFTCDELTLQIVENPIINRARLKKAGLEHGTALDVAKAASDRLSGPQGGYFGKFTTKRIQESEVGGLLVVTATFGCTVYDRLSAVPSGDISGHWVEVPFVRIDALSSWLSSWISANISVDVSALRDKVDLSAYRQYNGYAPWTSDTSAVFNWTSGTTWNSDTGWGLEWLSAMNVWQLRQDQSPAYPIFDLLSDALSIPVPTDLQEQLGQTLTREYVYKEGIEPINDYLVLSSQISADYTNEEIDYKIEKSRQNLDLSVYTNVVRWPWTFYAGNFSPTDENTWEWGHHILRWTEEDGWMIGYWEETYDEETGESTTVWHNEGEIVEGKYSKYTLELKVAGFMGVEETIISRTSIDHYISEGEMLATTGMLDQYRAKNDLFVYGTSFKPWTSETGITLQWAGVQYRQYVWETPHEDGEDFYSLTRPEVETGSTTTWYLYMRRNGAGYAQDITASPDATQLEITNASIATYLGTWLKRADAIPSFSISNPNDRIMLSSNLSAYIDDDSWPMRTLSAEYDENLVRIRTYDGIDHYVDISSMASSNDFNRYGFTYDDNPLSGIMELAIPHLKHSQAMNLYQSKIKRIWIPSDVVDIRSGFCNSLPELETVLLYDYTPGNFSKTLRLQSRTFFNCPNLRRVELPGLSVTWPTNMNPELVFRGSPLSAEDAVRPDIKPGLWLYGYLSGETHARQNLSALIEPEKIHVADILGQSGSESGGDYLPLSGGTLTGELSMAIAGSSPTVFAGDNITIDPGTAGETVINFPTVGGSHDVAYKDLTWQKTDTELSVGVGRYKAFVEPGELLARDDGNAASDTQKRTQYMWDGMVYSVIDNSGPTPVTHNYNLMYPTAGGTLATREWTNAIVGDISTLIHNT